jgi:hypothetical protein
LDDVRGRAGQRVELERDGENSTVFERFDREAATVDAARLARRTATAASV